MPKSVVLPKGVRNIAIALAANAARPRCTRLRTDGALRVQAKAGVNRLRFEGRMNATKKLMAGSYSVVFTATNAARRTSPPKTLRFTIAGG